MHYLLYLVSLFVVQTYSQNIQTWCREFCSDGSYVINGKCSRKSVPLNQPSADGYKISGKLTCKWFDKGPENAIVTFFDKCDDRVYREIANSTVKHIGGNVYYYEMSGRNKLLNANLFLLIKHACMKRNPRITYRKSLFPITMKCEEDCTAKCKKLKSSNCCDCNRLKKTNSTAKMNCQRICGSPKNKGCTALCQELTYCESKFDFDLYYY